MKPFSFSSPYAFVGLFFGAILLAGAGLIEAMTPDLDTRRVAPQQLPWKLIEPPALETVRGWSSQAHDDIPNFRQYDHPWETDALPCFTVRIDPTVAGAREDYRSDLFGNGPLVASAEVFTEALKEAMAADFSAEAWARDPNCFDGSFVVSFSVTETGRLGDDMLVHHLRGQSNQAGISVLDVLREMDRNGHRWHDGTGESGIVRIPVKFKLG